MFNSKDAMQWKEAVIFDPTDDASRRASQNTSSLPQAAPHLILRSAKLLLSIKLHLNLPPTSLSAPVPTTPGYVSPAQRLLLLHLRLPRHHYRCPGR